MVLIGFSGHAMVAIGILEKMGIRVSGYCDSEEKKMNPFNIHFLGSEKKPEVAKLIHDGQFFISVGNNIIRRRISTQFASDNKHPATIIHPASFINTRVEISNKGVMIAAGVCINPLATIAEGVILNTGCVVEHECSVSRFAHVGPGATLCGNVSVGENSFIGAGAVVRENISIGKNATIGAGAVIVKNVPDGACVVGNPGRNLNSEKQNK